LRDSDVLLIVVLGEEEETGEADLLDVKSDEDMAEGLGVEEPTSLR
jgi:hypothetical protein